MKNVKGMGVFAAASSISKLALGLGKTVKGEHWLDNNFPRYTDYNPEVPVWCVIPDIDRCISRSHLSSPISPPGRYVEPTKLSREDRQPDPGEAADIVLVDLKQGITPEIWNPHNGQRSASDYTNAVENGQPVTRVNLTPNHVQSVFIVGSR